MVSSGRLAGSGRKLAPMKSFVVPRRAAAWIVVTLMVWIPLLALVVLPVEAQVASVTIGSSLDPANLTVTPGSIVTWDNIDSERHRVQSTSGPEEFDSGNLESGESFSFTFTLEGTYQYEDARDPDLSNYWGTIVVAADGSEPPPPGGTADFTMSGRVFRPTSITVDPGTTVTFLNDDDRDHTVTATDLSYDSGIMNTGDSYQRVYATPGTFEFFCAIHPDMVATVIVTGDGGEPPPPPPPPDPPAPPPPGDVELVDFAFSPDVISVPVATTLTFVNAGAALHTVTALDGSFDSGLMSAGATFSRSFDAAGTYNIFCTLHPTMTATVLVSDGEEPPPPAPPPPDPPPVDGDMVMVDFAYQPTSLTIDLGSTITFANAGVAPHTVTARSGLFDSGFIASGDTYTRTFDEAGTYQIFCTIHPEMSAEIIVPGGDGAIPPPAPPPPPPPLPAGGDIQIFDFGYDPGNVTVPAGSTLTWVNTGVALHTVTDRAGSFDSGFMNTGDTYARTFPAAGTFVIFCTLHPNMQSSVIVTGADGSAPPPPEAPPPPAPVPTLNAGDVVMGDFFYNPITVTVQQGSTIRWVNTGAALHTVTAADGSFDSGFRAAGESYVRTFDAPGTFNIFCTIHPQMVGTVVVLDSSGTAPPPSAPVAGPDVNRPEGRPAPVGEVDDQATFVRVFDFGYQPELISVREGTEIAFFNAGAAPHTVTDRDGSFDSGIFQSGETYRYVAEREGVFDIFCTLHPQMVATLVVLPPAAGEEAGEGPVEAVQGLVDQVSEAVAGNPDWHQVPTESSLVLFGLLGFLLAIPAAVWLSWRRAVRHS